MAETKVLSGEELVEDAASASAAKDESGEKPTTTKAAAASAASSQNHGEEVGDGLEVRYSEGTESYGPAGWCMLEISTQNRVYRLNSALVCFEVADIETKKPAAAHGLLGARLVGGQKRDGDALTLIHPFPVVGSEAVFEKRTKDVVSLSTSSTVRRVVLNLRRVRAGTGERTSWDQIASADRVNPGALDADDDD
jgi:hypothetical protein